MDVELSFTLPVLVAATAQGLVCHAQAQFRIDSCRFLPSLAATEHHDIFECGSVLRLIGHPHCEVISVPCAVCRVSCSVVVAVGRLCADGVVLVRQALASQMHLIVRARYSKGESVAALFPFITKLLKVRCSHSMTVPSSCYHWVVWLSGCLVVWLSGCWCAG